MVLSGELVIDGYILQGCVVSVFFGDKSPLVTVMICLKDIMDIYFKYQSIDQV